MQDANKECSRLKKRLDQSVTQSRTLKEQKKIKDKRIHELQSRLKQSDKNARMEVDKVKGFRCICILLLWFDKMSFSNR